MLGPFSWGLLWTDKPHQGEGEGGIRGGCRFGARGIAAGKTGRHRSGGNWGESGGRKPCWDFLLCKQEQSYELLASEVSLGLKTMEHSQWNLRGGRLS